jgi:DNA-binding LacI/PurR family transcriptional regulator
MPTVADVARAAGVAAITVSRVVNETSYVSLEKQKKIRAAINKLGYRPNQAARILKDSAPRSSASSSRILLTLSSESVPPQSRAMHLHGAT